MFNSILNNMIKDTDEHPDEEIHRVGSGRFQITEASVPMELGCITLLVNWMCSPTWNQNIIQLGFYGGFLT